MTKLKWMVPMMAALMLNFGLAAQSTNREDSATIRKIYTETLLHGKCYGQLRDLCKNVGNRISGSPQAAKAVEWGLAEMKKIADTAYLQEVMVPHWVRGAKEKAWYTTDGKTKQNIEVLALGMSVGTATGGVTGEIIAADSVSDLKKLGDKVKGKIVYFRRPMNAAHIVTFDAYGDAYDQRFFGPSEAAKYGAKAVIIRSLASGDDDFPHTGTTRYEEGIAKIPAAAVSTNTANMLDKLLAQKKTVSVHLELFCKTLPDVRSHNVVGEIRGSEVPEEIILVGGHLDSWDVGEGAHDDGAGCVQSMEVLRTIKALGLKPKRTIRAVLFMNEENGTRGGKKYGELAEKNREKNIVAIESDEGGHTPRGFDFQTDVEKYIGWSKYFEPYSASEFKKGDGGADIQALLPTGTLLISFKPDSQRYFDYHHTNNDTFEKVNKRELEMGAATMTGLVYLFSTYGVK